MVKKRRETAKARLARLKKPNPFRLIGREDYWRDPNIWAEAASAALNVESLEGPIKLAFEAFKLDPSAPMTGVSFFTRSPAFTSASQQENREDQRFGGIAIWPNY